MSRHLYKILRVYILSGIRIYMEVGQKIAPDGSMAFPYCSCERSTGATHFMLWP